MDLSREHPFPGLRPFDFRDREFFFGREEQTYALYRLLDRSRFVAVVGSSGSGKSSLVRAGLLPLLGEESEDDDGGARWRFATLHPGDDPIRALADAVVSFAIGADLDEKILAQDVATALTGSSFGLSKAVEEIPGLRGHKILLVVDQFEELFRYAGRRDDATNFVQLLLEATRSHSSPIHVLVTMRSDFIGDCAQFQRLPEAVSAAQFLVPSLTRDQREQVIRRPVEIAAAAIESLLVERLLNDAGGEIDQLPVLQHCLSRLWECAPSENGTRHLGIDEYEGIGGMSRALSQHADAVMNELGSGLEPVVESVFRALSETDADGRATRRAIPFAQLLAETGVIEADLRRVLDRFRADDCSFIVPPASSVHRLADGTRLDVVHEALLRRWERISAPPALVDGQRESGWLAAEGEDGWEYRALLNLVKTGSTAGNVTLPLDQIESRWNWWRSRKRTAAWAKRYGGGFELVEKLFADSNAALEAHLERERTAAQAARERQAQEEQRRRIEERRRIEDEFASARARRTRNAAIAMALLAVIAVVSAAWALKANFALEAKERALTKAYATLNERKDQLAIVNGHLNTKTNALTQLGRVQRNLLKKERSYIGRQTALIGKNKRLQAAVTAKNVALGRSNEQLALLNSLREAERVHYQGSQLKMVERYVAKHPNDAGARVDLGDAYLQMNQSSQAAAQYSAAVDVNQKYAYAYASLCQAADLISGEMHDQNQAKAKLRYALENCKRAVEIAPNMTYALRQEAVVERDLGNYPAAAHDLLRAIAIDPSESFSTLELCDVQFDSGAFGAAIRSCTLTLTTDPGLTQANYWRGRAEFRKSEWSNAVEDFSRRIAADPKQYSAYYWRGRAKIERAVNSSDLQQQIQDLNGAIADLSFLLENDAKDYSGDAGGYDAHYYRGVAEYDSGSSNTEAAVDDLSLALRSGPSDVAAHYWRGKGEIKLHEWGPAIEDFSRTHGYSISSYWLALAHFYATEYRDALADIERYIAANARDGDGYFLLAKIQLDAGDAAKARRSAATAMALYRTSSDQSNVQAFLDEIRAMERRKLMATFVADSEAVLQNARNANALADRGDIYETVADQDSAISDYSSAIAVNPLDAYAFASRCQSRREIASNSAAYKDALADCNKAIAIEPNMAYALRERARIDLALLDLDDLTAANSDATRAVSLAPQSANNVFTRCLLYVHMERYGEAIGDCSTAIKLDPGLYLAYYWRALARLNTGDYSNGIADVQSYLRSNAGDPDAYLLQAKLELGLGSRGQAQSSASTALAYYRSNNNQAGASDAQKFLNDLAKASSQGSQ